MLGSFTAIFMAARGTPSWLAGGKDSLPVGRIGKGSTIQLSIKFIGKPRICQTTAAGLTDEGSDGRGRQEAFPSQTRQKKCDRFTTPSTAMESQMEW